MLFPHIVIANSPTTYRDLLASVLPVFRPELRVLSVDPGALDRLLDNVSPPVVICSQVTARLRSAPAALIVLYPEGLNLAVVAAGGEFRQISNPELSDLLTIIDDILTQPNP